MLMTASPLAVLTALPPGGRLTAGAASTSPQKTAPQAADADPRAEPTTVDEADTPPENPSFAQMLRDQTSAKADKPARKEATARPEQEPRSPGTTEPALRPDEAKVLHSMHRAGHDPKDVIEKFAKAQTDETPVKSDGDVKTSYDREASDIAKVKSESSEQLVDWLAILMKSPAQGQPQEATQGRSPVSATDQGSPAGLEQAAWTAANATQAVGGARRDAKVGTTKPTLLAADRAPGADAKALKPAAPLLTRETAPSTSESSRSAPAGSPADSRAAATATAQALQLPDAPPATKPLGQRPGNADTNPSLSALPTPASALTAATAAPHATTSASASTAASPATDTFIQQDVRRPEFMPAFSARIATLVQEGVEHARVHLNPVDMGPVTLQLALEGQQVRVDMTAEVAATRQVLEQALPTLAGALREAGFTLSAGGVAPPAEAANTGGQDARGSQGSPGEPSPQSSSNPTGLSGQASDGRRQAQGEPGQAPAGSALRFAEGLTAEIPLDANGTPRLPQGRGLVDTFA